MAGCNLTTSTIRATLAAAALICLAATARADLVYHLTACGGGAPQPGSPCFVQQEGGPPPANAADGLNEAAFEDFFNGHGLSGNEPYGWTVNGGNKAGYLFGDLAGQGFFLDTQFVFFQGQVLCCYADFPYRLIALNDHGLFIGDNGGQPFVSSEIDPFNVFSGVTALDAASQQFLADQENWHLDGARFLAIDNADRISGVSAVFGGFILTPVDPAAVPEPGSLVLLVGMLALLMWRYKRINGSVE